MAEIKLNKVCKRYGETSVIEGLDLQIREKEFMVLVGPSGCGKSTLLRMIAGLEEVSDGALSIGDRIVNNVHPKDRDVAMVFQSYALYPHMTVRENISFGLKVRKTPQATIDKLVNEVSETLGLAQLLDRKPKALSGGQRQRVALGRAIVRKPSVFLFDEPLSNLDAELRVQMRAEISKLQKRLQITSVYVTHDQVEAMTMGHRITVLSGGNVMQVGTPLELYESPANVFVAGFIGTPPMNLIKATISDGGDKIEAEGLTLQPTGANEELTAVLKAHKGRKIVLGIRPEHIGSGPTWEKEGYARFSGEVDVVEPLGHEVITHVKNGNVRLVAKLPPNLIPELGSELTLSIRPDILHLFDQDTEQRLTAN